MKCELLIAVNRVQRQKKLHQLSDQMKEVSCFIRSLKFLKDRVSYSSDEWGRALWRRTVRYLRQNGFEISVAGLKMVAR